MSTNMRGNVSSSSLPFDHFPARAYVQPNVMGHITSSNADLVCSRSLCRPLCQATCCPCRCQRTSAQRKSPLETGKFKIARVALRSDVRYALPGRKECSKSSKLHEPFDPLLLLLCELLELRHGTS